MSKLLFEVGWLLVLYVLLNFVKGDCPRKTEWKKPLECPEKTLNRSQSSASFSTGNSIYCAQKCNQETCFSFSYDTPNKRCHHFDTIVENCSVLIEETLTSYYFMKFECFNGGKKSSSASCACGLGYFGRRCEKLATGCEDLYNKGYRSSGAYPVRTGPDGPIRTINCIGKKTIALRHWGALQQKLDFNRTWDDMVNGFGYERIYWCGLQLLHEASVNNTGLLTVRANSKISYYHGFRLYGEDTNYRLIFERYADFSGVGDFLNGLNGSSFSTFDRDNDRDESQNCALEYGFGFWFSPGICSLYSPFGRYECPRGVKCKPETMIRIPLSGEDVNDLVFFYTPQ